MPLPPQLYHWCLAHSAPSSSAAGSDGATEASGSLCVQRDTMEVQGVQLCQPSQFVSHEASGICFSEHEVTGAAQAQALQMGKVTYYCSTTACLSIGYLVVLEAAKVCYFKIVKKMTGALAQLGCGEGCPSCSARTQGAKRRVKLVQAGMADAMMLTASFPRKRSIHQQYTFLLIVIRLFG